MSTPRTGLPRWIFGETEMTQAPRTEMEWKMCTCNQMEGRKTCPIHPPEIAEPTPSPEQFEKINEESANLNRYDFAEAYADMVSKPLRERISELDKELAEEKRRSNALLNLGRGEGNSDATR